MLLFNRAWQHLAITTYMYLAILGGHFEKVDVDELGVLLDVVAHGRGEPVGGAQSIVFLVRRREDCAQPELCLLTAARTNEPSYNHIQRFFCMVHCCYKE